MTRSYTVYCSISYDFGRCTTYKSPVIDAVDDAAAAYIARDRYAVLGEVTVSLVKELPTAAW